MAQLLGVWRRCGVRTGPAFWPLSCLAASLLADAECLLPMPRPPEDTALEQV